MNKDDKKLEVLYRLKGLASATTKAISQIVPGARKVAEQKTEVVAGIFCFFVACFISTFFAHSAPPVALEGLQIGSLLATALTGGHLLFRLIPHNRALRKHDALEALRDKVEQLKRENTADRKRAGTLSEDGYERLLIADAVAQRLYEIASLRNLENQVLADDLGVAFNPPAIPPLIKREPQREPSIIFPDGDRGKQKLGTPERKPPLGDQPMQDLDDSKNRHPKV